MQKDFSPAADADSIDDMADDMIEMTDEEGTDTMFFSAKGDNNETIWGVKYLLQ